MNYDFAGFRLDAAKRQLIGIDGSTIHLPSRAYDVLLYMAERPGEMLEKSALLQAVWPKTVVEENNLTQCIFALRRALGDNVSPHRFIATVPGRGYQFVATVRAASADDEMPAAPASPAPTESPPAARRAARRWFWATLAASTVIALLAWIFWPATARAVRQMPAPAHREHTLAVLPFADLSPQHDMEYFSDGITEELMSKLARVDTLRVVGRHSAFAFKGRNEDARSIGEKLKVESILEGSVRKSGGQLRITAQLVRTSDEFSLWSQTYDRRLDDVLDVQQSIAREVTAALSPLVASGTAGSRPWTTSAEANDAYLRGIYVFGRGTTVDFIKSRDEFRRASELDPEFALAHAWYGRTLAILARQSIGDVVRTRAEADASLARALKLDPQLADLWWVRAWPTAVENLSIAMRANIYERALERDRSDPAPMMELAYIYLLMGRHDDMLALEARAHEADPLWPNTLVAYAYGNLAFGTRPRAEQLVGELETVAPADFRAANIRSVMAFSEGRALDWDRWKARAIELAPRNQPLHGMLSLDHGHLGLLDAALHHARMCKVLNPESAGSDYNIAHIQLFAGNIEAAKPVVRRAMAERPDDYLAQLAQAELQYFTGDCAGAVHSTELARPAFRQPAASLDLFTDRDNVPVLIWCLRQQGNLARARELARVFELQNGVILRGAFDGSRARVAAGVGDRDALVAHLKAVDDSHSMGFTFARHEPMIQPYLADPEVKRLLDSIDARRAEWRRIIPMSSVRVAIPDVPKTASR